MKIRRLISAKDVRTGFSDENKFILSRSTNKVSQAVFFLKKVDQEYYWVRDEDQDLKNVPVLIPLCKNVTSHCGRYSIKFSEEDL